MKWIVLITISIFNNDYIFKDPYNTTIIKGECYSEQEWRKKNI